MKSYPRSVSFFLFLIVALGFLLRFYNLNWGAPYYFHPDERNIASAVVNLSYPDNLNPHFFAYGSLPIYLTYATAVVWNRLTGQSISPFQATFEQAILILRFLSVLFSTLLLILIYKAAKQLDQQSTGIFALFLATVSTGLIQYTHFGTYEMWLTFFYFAFVYTLVLYIKNKRLLFFLISTICLGISIALKVSSLPLLALPFIVLLYDLIHQATPLSQKIYTSIAYTVFLFVIPVSIFVVSNPYVLLDTTSFLASMQYESSVATGSLPVFYTQGFIDTTPVVFQLFKVFPFLLNPLLTLLMLPALVFFFVKSIQYKNSFGIYLLAFFILFASQAFLFVKWTRYMVPLLPFIYLFIALLVARFPYERVPKLIQPFSLAVDKYLAFVTISVISALFGISFFVTVYLYPDTRVDASSWMKQNLPPQQHLLSEPYDVGLTAFQELPQTITIFDFYSLDQDSAKKELLQQQLQMTNYVLLPSQRVLKSRLSQPEQFPAGHSFYTGLFDEKKYELVYKTNCNLFCRIAYLGGFETYLEETAYVFDRPTVYLFEVKHE